MAPSAPHWPILPLVLVPTPPAQDPHWPTQAPAKAPGIADRADLDRSRSRIHSPPRAADEEARTITSETAPPKAIQNVFIPKAGPSLQQDDPVAGVTLPYDDLTLPAQSGCPAAGEASSSIDETLPYPAFVPNPNNLPGVVFPIADQGRPQATGKKHDCSTHTAQTTLRGRRQGLNHRHHHPRQLRATPRNLRYYLL